jgi:hypothetical protein
MPAEHTDELHELSVALARVSKRALDAIKQLERRAMLLV